MANKTEYLHWIKSVAATGVLMDPRALAQDVVLTDKAFEHDSYPNRYQLAMTNTVSWLRKIIEGKVEGTALTGNLAGWYAFHYQSVRAQKEPANMRIVYRWNKGQVEVEGFGHRHLPSHFYKRLYPR
ncbi:MAG TPA: hypothetical protein VFV52_17820 [Bacilli bacterium]|nr:hypothetical protein [Bacilli bacterium]